VLKSESIDRVESVNNIDSLMFNRLIFIHDNAKLGLLMFNRLIFIHDNAKLGL